MYKIMPKIQNTTIIEVTPTKKDKRRAIVKYNKTTQSDRPWGYSNDDELAPKT